ncbi:MAG: HAMP domain-containing sensor histidine kinase [bacterium]
MVVGDLDKLAGLLKQQREALVAEWRERVRQLPSAQRLDTPTLTDHIPRLIDELVVALEAHSDETIPEALSVGSPPAHGAQRERDGYDIEEVVAEYNILRGCVHDLADANGVTLQGKPFHVLNRVLDSAIGLAVQTFAAERASEVQQRREEYLAFVAHDLRTPLNAITLASRVLELKVPEHVIAPETAQMLKTLRRNAEHLGVLVAKILEESTNLQTEVGIKVERRSFDLWPLVEGLIHDLHPVAGTDSTQLINAIPEDLVVAADASLLRRIFQNLIANAIAYTPRGAVTIGAQGLGEERGVECWVSDNGAGIAAEQLAKVFDQLETDAEKEGGMGLGLAIVKTFVEAHDGKVVVESQAGVGSTFRFTLPSKSLVK